MSRKCGSSLRRLIFIICLGGPIVGQAKIKILRPGYTSLSSSEVQSPKIRIRLQEGVTKMSFRGPDLIKRDYRFPGQKQHISNAEYLFKCPRKRFFEKSPRRLVSVWSESGLVHVGRQAYVGRIEFISRLGRRRGCDMIVEMKIDDYLATLLVKEVNKEWPIELLKSQAIAARTYAIHKRNSRQVSRKVGHNALYDLENSEKHQVNGHLLQVNQKVRQAVRATRGQVLTSTEGKLTPIFFHSECGGYTLEPHQVWENKVSGYRRVPCSPCQQSKRTHWEFTMTSEQIKRFLKWAYRHDHLPIDFVHWLRVKDKSLWGHNFSVENYTQSYKLEKALLRRYWGRVKVPSNRFQIIQEGGSLILKGKGNGHGVGMCQIGAYKMARGGLNYTQILKHYFPKHEIEKIF